MDDTQRQAVAARLNEALYAVQGSMVFVPAALFVVKELVGPDYRGVVAALALLYLAGVVGTVLAVFAAKMWLGLPLAAGRRRKAQPGAPAGWRARLRAFGANILAGVVGNLLFFALGALAGWVAGLRR